MKKVVFSNSETVLLSDTDANNVYIVQLDNSDQFYILVFEPLDNPRGGWIFRRIDGKVCHQGLSGFHQTVKEAIRSVMHMGTVYEFVGYLPAFQFVVKNSPPA
jgi:hypothetical protein